MGRKAPQPSPNEAISGGEHKGETPKSVGVVKPPPPPPPPAPPKK